MSISFSRKLLCYSYLISRDEEAIKATLSGDDEDEDPSPHRKGKKTPSALNHARNKDEEYSESNSEDEKEEDYKTKANGRTAKNHDPQKAKQNDKVKINAKKQDNLEEDRLDENDQNESNEDVIERPNMSQARKGTKNAQKKNRNKAAEKLEQQNTRAATKGKERDYGAQPSPKQDKETEKPVLKVNFIHPDMKVLETSH